MRLVGHTLFKPLERFALAKRFRAWLVLTTWSFVVGFGVWAVSLAVPVTWRALTTTCSLEPCMAGQPTPEGLAVLANLGFGPTFYAVTTLAMLLLVPGVIMAVTGVLIWRAPEDRVVVCLAFAGVTCSMVAGIQEAAGRFAWLAFPADLYSLAAGATFALALLLLPDGTFSPRWSRWACAALVAGAALPLIAGFGALVALTETISMASFLMTFPVALVALTMRYRRIEVHEQRQQIKWVLYGIASVVAIVVVNVSLYAVLPRSWMTPGGPGDLLGTFLGSSGIVFFWLCIVASVVRYRLFGIDIVIRRTLVYGGLSLAVTAGYVALVSVTGRLLAGADRHLELLLPIAPLVLIAWPLHRFLSDTAIRWIPPGTAPTSAHDATDGSMRSRRVMLRPLWWIFASAVLALIVIGSPDALESRLLPCTGEPCVFQGWRPSPERMASLDASGISHAFYATWTHVTSLLVPLAGFAILAITLARRRGDWVSHLLALAFFGFHASHPGSIEALAHTYPWVGWVNAALVWISTILLMAIFLVFPDGRFTPRWSRYLVPATVLAATPMALVFSPEPPDFLYALFPTVGVWILLVGITTAGSLIYRYRVVATPQARRQIWWILLVLLVGEPLRVALGSLKRVFGDDVQVFLLLDTAHTLLLLVVTSAIGIALLFYDQIDVGMVVRRTLVHGALTISVVAVYLGFIGAAGVLALASNDVLVSVVATGVVALVFHPLRERVQRGVNRLLYGYRDEPYQVISRLGRRLEATREPASVLPMTVETVAEALKLPYVAIVMASENAQLPLASVGQPQLHEETFPLVYGGEVLGVLVISPRGSEDALSRTDRWLLADLARQVGVALNALLLQMDLERSRLRIVTAREEARRQLGNDLHDTVGHELAGLTRRAEAAANLLEEHPEEAKGLLQELIGQGRSAANHVRALAHRLHPPELEVLGLVGVVREWATTDGDMTTHLDLPDSLPRLSAAVEVAAYCIVREALQNIQTHAHASRCSVRLALVPSTQTSGFSMVGAHVLEIDVIDNGCGFRLGNGRGLGLTSMRERARDVGGTLQVDSRPGAGTRLSARLPVPEEA